MTTVVTGAAGFVGQAVARRMLATGQGLVRLVDRLLPPAPSPAFEVVAADLTDRTALRAAVAGATCVIHLAALPGGAAEADPAASRRINLDVSLDLLELLAAQTPTRLVYASSIAVLGESFPASIDDTTAPAPATTYGAHKRMVEIAIADAVRRGSVDAVALRLPGIVARPLRPSGLKSAFISELFHAARAGRRCTVPVSPAATMWLLSVDAAADALLHAAGLRHTPAAVLTLPALRVAMADLVAALDRATGRPLAVAFAPVAAIEAQFGRLPGLRTPAADALGFVHDGDLDALVASARAGLDHG